MSGGAGEKIENERKYEVGPGFAVPGLSGVDGVTGVSQPETFGLMAVYFDTAGLHLAHAHVTLRRRTGGTDAGWHLKLPAGHHSRREVEVPLHGESFALPDELVSLAGRYTGGEPLGPVARLETTRTVRHLLNGEVALAELADDQVTGAVPAQARPGGPAVDSAAGSAGQAAGEPGAAAHEPGWRVTSRWREVEVELEAGELALLDVVDTHLRAAGATPSASPSKLSRVLREAGALPGE